MGFLCSNLLVNGNVGRDSHLLHDLINHDIVEGSLEEGSKVQGSRPMVTHVLSDLEWVSVRHVSVLCGRGSAVCQQHLAFAPAMNSEAAGRHV